MSINLLMVSAKVLLIPLIYSKVMLKGEISIAQLLTFDLKYSWLEISLMVNSHFSRSHQHLLSM